MKTSTFPKSARHGAQRGLTLVELCIVLAVIILLATAAAPGMRELIAARRLDGAATQLATDIQWIRTEAVARNEALRFSFHPSPLGSCYVIHTGSAAQCNCDAVGPAQCTGGAKEIKTVTVAAADEVQLDANVSSVLFDPLHGTASPSGTLSLDGYRGRTVRHIVNIMGRVRSCSPQAVVPGYRAC